MDTKKLYTWVQNADDMSFGGRLAKIITLRMYYGCTEVRFGAPGHHHMDRTSANIGEREKHSAGVYIPTDEWMAWFIKVNPDLTLEDAFMQAQMTLDFSDSEDLDERSCDRADLNTVRVAMRRLGRASQEAGFTLMEILIVVGAVGIMGSLLWILIHFLRKIW